MAHLGVALSLTHYKSAPTLSPDKQKGHCQTSGRQGSLNIQKKEDESQTPALTVSCIWAASTESAGSQLPPYPDLS